MVEEVLEGEKAAGYQQKVSEWVGLEGGKDGKLLVEGGDSGQKPSVGIRKNEQLDTHWGVCMLLFDLET